jgi:hypothetical protein
MVERQVEGPAEFATGVVGVRETGCLQASLAIQTSVSAATEWEGGTGDERRGDALARRSAITKVLLILG